MIIIKYRRLTTDKKEITDFPKSRQVRTSFIRKPSGGIAFGGTGK